jgi:ubiquitin carboxyl-terminal hydrolase L3
VECTEIFGFDDDLLKFVPGPHYALIFCYPCSDKAGDYLKQIYSDLEGSKGDKVPEGIFFMKQKIRNACGTFSLLHSLTNNVQRLEIGNR